MIFKKKNFRQDKINVSDGFLDKKIPEFMQYYPEMSGTMVDKYLFTNNEVRIQNNNKISELCGSPHKQRLWESKFHRMPGSSRAISKPIPHFRPLLRSSRLSSGPVQWASPAPSG